MPDDLPLAAAFAFLAVVAFCRGSATYAVGRVLRRAGASARHAEVFERPALRRAEGFVIRWGAPAVTASFLTVGVQSAVNASAGFLRMPLTRYVPAVAAGALVWAAIYVTIGLAVFRAWVASDRGLWLAAVALVVALLVGGSVMLRRRLPTP